MECPEEYTEESWRTFGDRLKGYLRAPSPIHQHSQTIGHSVNLESFTIVERESQGVSKTMKEEM